MPENKTANKVLINSPDEGAELRKLQRRLAPLFNEIEANPKTPRTVVVIPSLTFDEEILSKVLGSHLYEERMLCMLMLLRSPMTKIVYVTSMPVEECIIDYYLQMLPGIPQRHSLKRLTFISCDDPSPRPLTKKILERSDLMERIKSSVDNPGAAKISCYNSTFLERTLAVRLGIPMYSCDPELLYLGSKSGSREIFREVGLNMSYGHENLRDQQDISEALADIKKNDSGVKRAVIKHNYSGDGIGNAVYEFGIDDHTLATPELARRIKTLLPETARLEAKSYSWEEYIKKFKEHGGIAESWIEGEIKRSPSAQFKITPTGEVRVESTHDQVLSGRFGQMFTGCSFPADSEYRIEIQDAGRLVAERLRDKGVINVLGVDFVSVKEGALWKSYAIEINLRKGGTTFPYMWLRYLTDGSYETDTGHYRIKGGAARYYYSSDNLHDESYKGLKPHDILDTMVNNGLHFHSASQTGVVFHMLGAIRDYGKFGVTCIGASREQAKSLYEQTISVMNSALKN